MTFPQIHTNGTSRETLFLGYQNASDKLREFITAWEAIEFNARDYYPIGNDAFTKARGLRFDMESKIRGVKVYLDSHVEHVYHESS